MIKSIQTQIRKELDQISQNNLQKNESIIESPQGPLITIRGRQVINFAANNYLGFANDPRVIAAAQRSLARWGYGLASVRFISGTLSIHKELEEKLSTFLGVDDAILYSSCFDANGGLFETIAGEEDCIISDRLNHASIIDGIRLSKAERRVFQHADTNDLAEKLKETNKFRRVIVVTDGVFSMDGDIANLPEIVKLANQHGALVVVDDSHAIGVIGDHGKGTFEYHHLLMNADIVTGTFGKALGGASGGFVAGKKEIINLLRQRSRPYLFSNSLAPLFVETTLTVLELLQNDGTILQRLHDNAFYFRNQITSAGFNVKPGVHPIIPLMLNDEKITNEFAKALYKKSVFAVGFTYPVVPLGSARIRIQISAAHTRKHLDTALAALTNIGKKLKIISM